MNTTKTSRPKLPALPFSFGVVCALAFVFCLCECLPFAKPAGVPDKAWRVHLVNTFASWVAMWISAFLSVCFLTLSAIRYARLKGHTS